MTDKEALKLALEALELLTGAWQTFDALDYGDKAITAIKEALEEHAMREVQRLGQEIEQAPYSVQQAYAMAQVCLDLHDALGCKWGDNVYLAIVRLKAAAQPAQRTWVGLTEQEHTDIAVECGCMSADWVFYGAAVERKIKEKNTI